MGTRRHTFPGATGANLVAQLELPDGAPRCGAVLAHCFTCGKDLKSLVRLARELAGRGVATLRFDFTGIGESAGEFAQTTLSTNVGDVVAAADFVRSLGLAPAVLVGHSLGGAAALLAARRVPDARLVTTIASPSDTTSFRETLLRLAPGLAERGSAEIVLGGRRHVIDRQMLDDLDAHAPALEDAIANLGRTLIVFQSPADETLPAAHGDRIFAVARPPKNFLALEGAGHLMLDSDRDTRYIAAVIGAWVERYVSPA